ncbi:MAG: hypothetical protein L6R39_007673 [Caloplaca ligustica]|nr:MAG: hypothetical protein L6R39_007673 [Caloplaca ligustica]
MSHLSVDSIISAGAYNRLLVDHEASERAVLLDLKRKLLPALSTILNTHGVADSVELHLLHRHFMLQEGEAVVHKTLEIPSCPDLPGTSVDLAKAISCPESVKTALVPLLWMASPNGNLVAYEYGLRGSLGSHEPADASIPLEVWSSFAAAFAAHVHSAGIADIVSLKNKQCINGGEYVAPDMRVLFRLPMVAIDLQPGSGLLESGWEFDAATGPGGGVATDQDQHVTQTRQTTGGTVATYHKVTQRGKHAFNPEEVPLLYTDAMWATAQSKGFWAVNEEVGVAA